MLKSEQMKLSPHEKSWLPWFGKTGKVSMRWSTLINRPRYPILEQTFEGIAATRNSGMTEIVERMFNLIQSIADSSHRYGNDVQAVTKVTESMRGALDQLSFSVARARQTSLRLRHLSSQFQVTQLQVRPGFH